MDPNYNDGFHSDQEDTDEEALLGDMDYDDQESKTYSDDDDWIKKWTFVIFIIWYLLRGDFTPKTILIFFFFIRYFIFKCGNLIF